MAMLTGKWSLKLCKASKTVEGTEVLAGASLMPLFKCSPSLPKTVYELFTYLILADGLLSTSWLVKIKSKRSSSPPPGKTSIVGVAGISGALRMVAGK